MIVAKKQEKRIARTTGRMVIMFVVFNAVVATMGYTLIYNFAEVGKMKKDLKELKKEKVSLLEQEEAVQADIKRLSDPEYVARYVREKHFFSRDNEIILRMDD